MWFGQGQHNTFVLDNFSHNWASARANMSLTENEKDGKPGLERPATNNTLRIVNGSNFRFYDFICSAACTGNTIEIMDSVVLENYPGGEAQFLADINAKLPERCTAYKTDSALYLRVRPYTGLTVIVR